MITGNMKWLVGSICFSIVFIASLIWPPYNLMLEERLRMNPGFPSYDWWIEPPNTTLVKMTFFNITNAERFLNNLDAKMNLDEIGPVVFREVITHSDVVFNDNGTMSYTMRMNYVYEQSLNNVDLNTTIYVPNLPVMITLSNFWNYNYFFKKILNFVFEKTNSKAIVKKSLYEILHNNTNTFLRLANAIVPSVAFRDNIAVLPMFNNGYSSRITVYIGNKYGHQKYFLIDKINGSIYLPTNDGTCKDKVANSTHGIVLKQLIEKTERLRYFYIGTCGIFEYTFQDEVYRQGLKSYRFVLSKDVLDRTQPPENDCFKGRPTLPNGLSDLSLCWQSLPIARSNPHFLYGDPKLLSNVNGMKPNASKHISYVVIEPITGVMMASRAYIQINMYVRPWTDFDKSFEKFNNIVLPLFYFELGHDHVPSYVVTFLRFVLVLPIVGNIFSGLLLVAALFCAWKYYRIILKKNIGRKVDTKHSISHETKSFIEIEKKDVRR